MSVARAIFARLTTAEAIVALCRKAFAADAEEAAMFPRLVYDVTDEQDDRTYGGTSGLTQAFVDIDCIDRTYTKARELGRAVFDSLDNQLGSWGGVTVKAAFVRGKYEQHSTPVPGGRSDTYTNTIHLEIWIIQ